jgi:hypothetical protein
LRQERSPYRIPAFAPFSSAGGRAMKVGKAAFAPPRRHSPHLPPPHPAHSVTTGSSRITRYVRPRRRARGGNVARPERAGFRDAALRKARWLLDESRPHSRARRTRRVEDASVATPRGRTARARVARDATLARARGARTLAEATRRVRRADPTRGKSQPSRARPRKNQKTEKTPFIFSCGRSMFFRSSRLARYPSPSPRR